METGTTISKESVLSDLALSPSDEILKKYTRLQITDDTVIEEPRPFFTINNEVIATNGGLVCFSGPSKSGKSAVMGVILAGAIAQGEYDGFPGWFIEPANGKAIIHFDTEQLKHKHKKNLLSNLKRAMLEKYPENYLSYNIRELTIKESREATSEIVKAANEKFNGVHMILIDGIADYVNDPNEPNQSNEIVKYFDDMALTYNCPVITIIHTNPGTDKERGHLGSQLQRKCVSVLTVKTEGEISRLEPKLLREAGKNGIPLVQFQFDKDKGYHVYCGIMPKEAQNAKDEKRIKEIQEIATKVFLPTSSFSYSDAIEKIMKETKKGEVTAKGILKEMKAHDIVINENGNWKNANRF